jgi:hypothetical protein
VSLAEYQRQLLTALTPAAPVRSDPAPRILADAIVEVAQAELSAVCPIVTGLLSFDERLTAEVCNQLQQHDRPVSIHTWGVQFATRLTADPDPWVSWGAQVDAGTLAAESRRLVDPNCPGDPMRAMLLIASGHDPRSR